MHHAKIICSIKLLIYIYINILNNLNMVSNKITYYNKISKKNKNMTSGTSKKIKIIFIWYWLLHATLVLLLYLF